MSLRVHAFARRFPSRSQTFVLSQCSGLLQRGVDLTIFADSGDDAGVVHPDAEEGALMARTRHYHIPEPWPTRPLPALRLLAGHGPLSLGQRLALLAPWRGAGESRSLRLLFEGDTVAREGSAQLMHAHFGPVGAMVVALRDAGAVSSPLVTTFYGYDVSRIHEEMYRRLFASGDAFLVLGDVMRERLVAMGAPRARVHIHRLGVDLTRFVPRTDARQGGGALELLSIARLVPKKGIADALHAVARVRRRHPSLRYTIIGDGPLRTALESLAVSLGIGDAVRFAGWRPPPEVLALARGAHALLAPSVTAPDGDAEGTPVAILEAQALALPVVATRHAGIPDIVVEGETAILVNEHDVDGLVAAIESIADPAAARRMGDAGRALVERQHDIHRLNDQLLARYRTMAAS